MSPEAMSEQFSSEQNEKPKSAPIVLLLAYSSTRASGGKEIPASRIFDVLMSRSAWFVPNMSKRLAPGARVLFYEARAGFRGYADVAEFRTVSAKDVPIISSLGIDFLKYALTLSNIHVFTDAVPLGPHVAEFEFVTNKKHWGQSVRYTPRVISWRDFSTVLNLAASSQGLQR